MKLLISILSIGIFLISCSNSKKDKKENIFVNIDGWQVIVEKGVTDTLDAKNNEALPILQTQFTNKSELISLIPYGVQPELYIQFINESDPTCLIPYLNFYPIELEEYIEKALINNLMFRANPFPPRPNVYTTDTYYVIGWNLVSYDAFKCCDCKNLESELIKKLHLQLKERNIGEYKPNAI